jgi:hypothetical protein
MRPRPKPIRSKIGFSKNYLRRFNSIAWSLKITDLVVDSTFLVQDEKAARKMEKELHERYAHKALGHEWFRLNEDDIHFIALHFPEQEFQREMIQANKIREGLLAAKARGVKLGRKPFVATPAQIDALRKWKVEEPRPTLRELQRRLGTSLGTAHRLSKLVGA